MSQKVYLLLDGENVNIFGVFSSMEKVEEATVHIGDTVSSYQVVETVIDPFENIETDLGVNFPDVETKVVKGS